MLQKPNLHDESIVASLQEGYRLPATEIEFMPIGNDASAWVYRVSTRDQRSYFLKVKKGEVYKPSVVVPHALRNSGIEQVVAPLSTHTGALLQRLGGFSLTLYPFIEGHTGMQSGLSDSQWVELGRVMQRIHTVQLPAAILTQVKRETFVPGWIEVVRTRQKQIMEREFHDPYEQELAAFWQSKNQEISKIVERAEELGRQLQQQSAPFVLCHADIHTANVLVDPDRRLYIVDWDQPLLAPRERDLMFVVGEIAGGVPVGDKPPLFFQGYGETAIDALTLAYYRYEWVVQEIGDYGERVFRMADLGEETKQDAMRGFRQLFDPGDVVEAAYSSDASCL